MGSLSAAIPPGSSIFWVPAVAQRDQRDDFIDELAHVLSPSL
jgi:hypothetical protein